MEIEEQQGIPTSEETSQPVESAPTEEASPSRPTVEQLFGMESKAKATDAQPLKAQPPTAKPGIIPSSPAVAPYTPNFKVKVMNKEHEIPEMYRGLMKDAETEKQVREIFERSIGLDVVKAERARLQEEHKQVKGEHETLTRSLKTLSDFLNNGDLEAFFSSVKITDEQIMRYAAEKLQYGDLNDQQRRQYDEAREAKRRAYWEEQEKLSYQAQVEQFHVEQRQAQLSQVMSAPDVAHVVEAFDQRHGPGSFQSEVIQLGQMIWSTQQRDATPQELVSHLARKYGAFIQPQQSQPQVPPSQPAQQQAPKAPQAPKQVPVIPTPSSSGGVSPAQRTVRTTEDLERLYQEKYGR